MRKLEKKVMVRGVLPCSVREAGRAAFEDAQKQMDEILGRVETKLQALQTFEVN